MNTGDSLPPRIGRHIVLDGVRIHYVKIGDGKRPLIILPGITSPAATWEFVARSLSPFRDVYIMDIRGRGLSQGGASLSYGLSEYASDLIGLIKSLKLDQPIILGHSMGARIAIKFAAANSALVEKLILVDPPVSGPGRRSYPIPLEYYLESLASVSRGSGYDEIKSKFGWSDEQINARMEWLPTCDSFAIAESYKSFHEESIHDDLPLVTSRSLLIYAQHGDTVRDEEAVEISSKLPNCEMKKIDNSGHMIPWDQLDAFISTVGKFIHYGDS